MVRRSILGFLLTFAFLIFVAQSRADVNVLVIGSTHDSSEQFGRNSKAFSPVGITNELNKILNGCGLGTVRVQFEDRYATGTSVLGQTHYAYNLASWFHWPYPAGSESNRWSNLRGEAGTNWNYVVLIPDPYTVEYMPGVFAYGAAKIAEEVNKSTNAVKPETVLLMPWPATGSSRNIAHYKEMIYRVGRSGGVKVAPGGLAWQAIKGTALTNPNPDADGAFIAAASIYSTIYQQSAKVSTYVYNDTWADTVNTTEANNRNAQQYTGNITFQNPFLFNADTQRTIYWSSHGTSTEAGFNAKIGPAIDRCKVGRGNLALWNSSWSAWTNNGGDTYWTKFPSNWPTPIAFNVGRDYLTSEPYKAYIIDPAHWEFAFPYYYQWNSFSQPVDAANDHVIGQMFVNDYDMADRMISEGNSGRGLPLRTMWAQIHQEFPDQNPLRDGSGPHLNYYEDEAVGTYIYTLYSGRCPLDKKPAGVDTNWVARKIGYETAWRLGRCQMRAPGYKVMPSSATALTITQATRGTNTVQFILPPRSNVTVNVTVDNSKAVIVNPHTLYFTTNNYDTAQSVTFTGLPGASTNDAFAMKYSTSSGDEVYNGLYDEWSYSTVRTVTQATVIAEKGTNSVTCDENTSLTINPGVAGMASNTTVFAGPVNGSISWSGTNMVYMPNVAYLGLDSFAYAVTNGNTLTRGYVKIDVVPSNNKALTVISARGGASPGSIITNSGTALSCYLTNSPTVSGTTQYVGNGAVVTGNNYIQVNPTNITLTLTNNATLTWAWTTNYWLSALTNGSGSLDAASGWKSAGSSVAITATASNSWTFTGWSGATGGCTIAGNLITIPMTNARSITANFATLITFVNNSSGATNQSETSATLQGLLATGWLANAWICWGDDDAGTSSTGAWDHVEIVGAVNQGVKFTALASGLASNRTYYYRSFVTNSESQAWSITASNFSALPAGGIVAVNSGGAVTNISVNGTNYTLHTFNNSGSLSFQAGGEVDVLVVGGGGGGGKFGGGGGAGGFIYSSLYTVGSGSYTVTIGGGGAGDTSDAGNGARGVDTVFGPLRAFGGGGGGSRTTNSPAAGVNGAAGGSGGGGSPSDSGLTLGGAATNGQGYAGGAETSLGWGGAGGGGAGAVGGNASSNNAGNGGNGLSSSMSGSPVYYAGGGGGCTYSGGDGTAGTGGLGGGGGGGKNAGGQPGVANTGGGGGGGDLNAGQNGGAGGSGVVMVRYPSFGTIINLAPGSITNTSARLNAALSTINTNYAVTVYWGTADGGTNAGAWAYNASVGSWTNRAMTNISYQATGLVERTTYYYAFRAVNAGSNAWASPSWQFATPGFTTATTNHSVPYTWLANQNPSWSTNYESVAVSDPDGDGFTTWEEYWSGTDPLNSNSFMQIDAISYDGTNIVLKWENAAVAGGLLPLTIQTRTNMLAGSWTNAGQKVIVNGVNTWTNSSLQQLFYRLAVTNTP